MNAAHEEKPEGAPEWMVSYADMITIIMSFFVIMFAIASGEAAKGKRNRSQQQQAAVDSLAYRFGPKWQPFASWGLMAGTSPVKQGGSRLKVKAAPPDEEEGTVKALKHERARIRIPGRGQHVVVGGMVSFDGASLELPEPQQARLKVIAEELAGKPQEIEVLGYGSPRPVPAGSAYHDRWDLAYARCRRVAQLLTGMNIAPDRLRMGVTQATDRPGTENATSPPEETRVDIYLSDTLPEKADGGGTL
jgi:chemotaxis protein MotB